MASKRNVSYVWILVCVCVCVGGGWGVGVGVGVGGSPLVTSGFPHKEPVMQSLDALFAVSVNGMLRRQSSWTCKSSLLKVVRVWLQSSLTPREFCVWIIV